MADREARIGEERGDFWVLALNTSTDALSAGVVPIPSGEIAKGRAPGERAAVEILMEPPAGRSGHSERLMPLIDAAVRMAGMTPADLDGVAVVAGPGGFTGVRTGLAVAKSIAQVLGIPVCGVDTLEVLAAGCAFSGLVAPLLDARRGDVFAALYRRHPDRMELVAGPRLEALEVFLASLPAGESITFAGEGAQRHADTLARHPLGLLPPPESHVIRPSTIARLAAPVLLGGGVDPLSLLPRYQRAPTMAPDWVASQ